VRRTKRVCTATVHRNFIPASVKRRRLACEISIRLAREKPLEKLRARAGRDAIVISLTHICHSSAKCVESTSCFLEIRYDNAAKVARFYPPPVYAR